jgi:putative membrane protein
LTVPLDFISYFHWGTVPLSMLILYVFVSLELISEEIEDPFQKGGNDLPTDDIAINIRNNATELLGTGYIIDNQASKVRARPIHS